MRAFSAGPRRSSWLPAGRGGCCAASPPASRPSTPDRRALLAALVGLPGLAVLPATAADEMGGQTILLNEAQVANFTKYQRQLVRVLSGC